MNTVPLFAELCAGLASVSGVLQHGSSWKPPVSRMGRKTGYAEAILHVMGLRPRQKAERYLWAEADGDVAALLAAYTQPDVMREIAAIIRSWIPCPYGDHPPDPSCSRCKGTGRWDARDLWEVLRREQRRGLWAGGGGAEEVAANLALHGLTNPFPIATNAEGQPYNAGGGGFTFNLRTDWRMDPKEVARRTESLSLPWPPVLIAQDARVEPGDVAGWAAVQAGSLGGMGEVPTAFERYGHNPITGERFPGNPMAQAAPAFSAAALSWPPVHLTPNAAIQPASIPPGTVVYIDPPYVGTTGYAHDFSRAAVCEAAERWATAGARVYISEAEPIQALGWHEVEISGERKGQARTFGNTREFLTCSHPPAWRPATQLAIFVSP